MRARPVRRVPRPGRSHHRLDGAGICRVTCGKPAARARGRL